MPTKEHVVAEAKRTLGGLEHLERMAAHVGLESMGAPDAAARVGPEEPPPAGHIERAAAEERARVVEDGLRGVQKVTEGHDADLTPGERFGLEAIILLEGRPAILVQEGDFMDPPKKWAGLKDARQQIDRSIGRIGRIEVKGHPDLDWLGTGFLVGPTIMTNRHVADEFSRQSGTSWEFRPNMSSSVDFKEEFGSSSSLTFEVVEVIGIHDVHDLALLKVNPASTDGSLATPFEIQPVEPDDLKGRQVYVIGYPAWDGRRNDPEPMRRIFMDIYNVKRLQPGELTSEAVSDGEIRHDCSTLGGNSGSPVIDLATHKVIGLHFGGRYLEGNHAVPLWTLVGNPLLARGQVNFV